MIFLKLLLVYIKELSMFETFTINRESITFPNLLLLQKVKLQL